MRTWRIVEAGSSGERMLLALLPALAGAVVLGGSLFMWPPLLSVGLSVALTAGVAWGLSRTGRQNMLVRELKGHLGFVLEHAPLVVWALDQKGHYTFLRGQGLRELKIHAADVLGHDYFTLNAEFPELLEHARKALSGVPFSADMPVKDRWYSTTYLPLMKDGVGTGFIAVSLDISERIAAEKEANAVHRELEAALQGRDEFLSIAAHELRTPLTSLKLRAQTMKRQLEKEGAGPLSAEKFKQLLGQIDKQASRLSRLVEDMIDFARIRNGELVLEPKEMDLGQITRQTVESMRPQFEAAHCQLLFLAGEEESPVKVDALRIDQVLKNFLTNALRYGQGRPVLVEVAPQEGMAIVRVTDQGIGVAPENQRRIFSRFQRAISANEVSGLGLGLFISQEIVEAHGGEIRLKSQLSHGSTFEMCLPLSMASAGSRPQVA
ncbi:MAG: PAS domain-containing sensor histidine kinase [Proteobacteria bacterium]|nr:MAG: PAS domain-containing sensor histidine kinase [Pseudomonadota bacterium]